MGVDVIAIHNIYRWQNWGSEIFNNLLKVTLQRILKARIQTKILLFFISLNVTSGSPQPWVFSGTLGTADQPY